jgi:hypothetical protein
MAPPLAQTQSSFTVNGKPASAARLGWTVAMIACFALTILYALGARFVSGHVVGRFELQHDNSLVLPGLVFSHSGPRSSQAGPVALDPSMSPVALVLHLGHTRLSSMDRLSCAIVMRDVAGHTIYEDDRVILNGYSGKSGGSGYSTLTAVYGTFDVPRPDRYAFDVRFKSRYGDPVKSVTLELRRNSSGPSPIGIGIGVVALALCFVAFLRAKPADASGASERAAA